jgi:hypothetical protein
VVKTMSVYKRVSWAAGCAIALLGIAAPNVARAQLGREIDGTYLFAGGNVEVVALKTAIERAALQLNVFIRPTGRMTLGRNLRVPSEIVLATTGDELAITIHPYPPRRSKLDGTATTFINERSDDNVLRRTVHGRAITETVVMGRITRRIRYGFSDDHRRLTMGWAVTIPQYFSSPIRYTLSYERR